MYIYEHITQHMHMKNIHVHVHVCARTHNCTHARTHTRTHARTHTHTRARTHAHTHTQTHTQTHTNTHTNTHTYTHTHTHSPPPEVGSIGYFSTTVLQNVIHKVEACQFHWQQGLLNTERLSNTLHNLQGKNITYILVHGTWQ